MEGGNKIRVLGLLRQRRRAAALAAVLAGARVPPIRCCWRRPGPLVDLHGLAVLLRRAAPGGRPLHECLLLAQRSQLTAELVLARTR